MTFGVTYTFVPGQNIDAGQVNQDFKDVSDYLNGLNIPTVPVPVIDGGTGATTAATALANLGGAPIDSPTFTGTPRAPSHNSPFTESAIATQLDLDTVVPTGVIMAYPGIVAPGGWLLCFGQSLDTTAFANLFAVIGYLYGGVGTSFNVPDLRGRVIAGRDGMGGVRANRLTLDTAQGIDGGTLGNAGGEQSHVQVVGELATHGHTVTAVGSIVANINVSGANGPNPAPASSLTANNTGLSNAFNECMPGIILNYIIKTGN